MALMFLLAGSALIVLAVLAAASPALARNVSTSASDSDAVLVSEASLP
jgi:hypothetical protein